MLSQVVGKFHFIWFRAGSKSKSKAFLFIYEGMNSNLQLQTINPLLPSVPYMVATFSQNFDFKFQKGSSKISYECRDYESVDETKSIIDVS